MCLDRVTSTDTEFIKGEGYKVFTESLCGPFTMKRFRLGEWHTAESHLIGSQYNMYQSGFHLFEKKFHAQEYLSSLEHLSSVRCLFGVCFVMKKVEYEEVIARGTTYIANSDPQCLDIWAPTIVAMKLRIKDEE